jgi:hypothetical protein
MSTPSSRIPFEAGPGIRSERSEGARANAKPVSLWRGGFEPRYCAMADVVAAGDLGQHLAPLATLKGLPALMQR